MRFGAALAVLFWHYQNLWFTPAGATGFVREAQPFYHYFRAFYEFGKYGVQVFWTISGYIFFWKYRESVAAGRVGGGAFFVLRFSRLYPLHFATLLLVAALQAVYIYRVGSPFVYVHNDAYHFLLHLFMASNWGFQESSSFNGPIWSISIEILVYIAFFLALRYLGRSLLWSVTILAGSALAYSLGGHNPVWGCFICFYVGGITASLAATPQAQRHRRSLLAIAMVVLVAVPTLAARLPGSRLNAIAPLLAIAYIPVFLYVMAEHLRIPRSLWSSVQVAGNMTYSSYLVHFPLQLSIAIGCAALDLAIPAQEPLFFVAYMATVLVLAWAIFRWFEMPCQALIRRSFAPRARGVETQTPGWTG